MVQRINKVDIDKLKNDDFAREFLTNALKSKDPQGIKTAIGDCLRARGVEQLSRDNNLSLNYVYDTLSSKDDLEIGDMKKLISLLGFDLSCITKDK